MLPSAGDRPHACVTQVSEAAGHLGSSVLIIPASQQTGWVPSPESEGHPLGFCPPSLSQEGWLLSDQVEQATVSEPPSTTLQVCWTNTGSHGTETLRSKQDGAEKPSLWVLKVRTPLPSLEHPHG